MHKNSKKIINLALIGAISSNNIIVFADEIKPKEVTQDTENLNIDIPSSTINPTILETSEHSEGTLEITLNEGEYLQDLTTLDTKYLTLVIKTTGNKQLESQDYTNIKNSQIPNIDLSEAYSTKIPSNAFQDCTFLKTFKFPNSLTSIGELAFAGCTNLTGTLTLPSSIKSLGSMAFNTTQFINKTLFINSSTNTIEDYNLNTNISDFDKIIFYIDTIDSEFINNKVILDQLLTSYKDKIVIELPYGLNIDSPLLKDYEDIIKFPTLSILDDSILDNPNNEIYTSEATLSIPVPYDESEIKITKNNEPYQLPAKNNDGSYTFKEIGLYKIELKTKSGTPSNITFEVVSFLGSITISHIDTENGEVLHTEIFDNLKIGEYSYKAKEIKGYTIKDDSSKLINITKENRNQTLIFKYSKNVDNTENPDNITGSVIVKYIDFESGKEIMPSELFTNLNLGKHSYTAQKITGYSLIDKDSISIELTKENPNKTIQFVYKKLKDTSSTVDKDTILSATEKGFDLLIISNNGTLKIYNSTLKKLKDKIDTISIDINGTQITNSTISNLLTTEKLNAIDSFTAYSNLSELEDGYVVNISRSIDGYTNKTLHLYKVNEKSKIESLQYIGEYTPVNGLVKFDINSKLLDGSKFIITSNKRVIDVNNNTNTNTNTNKPTTNNQTNNNSNTNTQDKDKIDSLPNSSGLGSFAPFVAITSTILGFFMIFNKKK